MSSNPGFGPMMIGDAAYAEQQRQAQTGGIGFGSRMTGPAVPVAEPAPPLAAADTDIPSGDLAVGAYAVKEVVKMLAEVPARTYDLFAAEVNRADGARKTALRAIRDTETAKGDEAKQSLITAIANILGE